MRKQISIWFMALAVAISLTGMAKGYPLTAALNSMQVVPMNDSAGSGHCSIQGDLFSLPWGYQSSFDVNCDFSGLSGPLTDADVRLERAGQNGNSACEWEKQVWVTLPNNGSGTVTIRCSGYADEGTNLAKKMFYVVLQTSNFSDGEIRGQIKPTVLDGDVDGEGRTEVAIFRPNDGTSYASCTMNSSTIHKQLDWISQVDSTPFLADMDGDAIADWTFIRTDPVDGSTLIMYKSSRNGQLSGFQWGNANLGDQHVFGDYNGDGRIGVAVFRTSNNRWYSSEGPFPFTGFQFGQAGDTPCAGDFDGDGKTDLCLTRRVEGQLIWLIRTSSNNYESEYGVFWGLATDTIYPHNSVDTDGDGNTNILVSRIEDGKRTFYATSDYGLNPFILQWGLATDTVKFGDYDNDGKTDFAAIREIDGQLVWFIHQSSDGQMRVNYWGLPGDN